jgi:hypothetical protein
MKYKVIQYSLCVWLTSVVTAPAIFIGVQSCINHGGDYSPFSLSNASGMYLIFTIFHLLFSIITWLVFMAMIAIVTQLLQDLLMMRWIIFAITILLTIASFVLFLVYVFSVNINDAFFLELILSNCFCVGAYSWIYKLEPIS